MHKSVLRLICSKEKDFVFAGGNGFYMRKTKALTQLLRKGLFILCILSAAFLSVWCITKNLQPVAQKYGAKWLLHIAGISIVPQTQLKDYPELSAPKTPVVSETGIEPDGVLETEPEVELRVEATPDPNRETGIVEVLKMSSGQRVDCFSVKDETGTGLDLEQELLIKPDISVRHDGSPVILLYSTHTTESYVLENGADWYYLDDDFRSLNPDETVVAVAREAAKIIETGGFGVIHDTTVHDYPAYSGSYARSMETIRKNLTQYPTISITVDIHRDAFGESGTTRYKPVAQVNGKQAAQIMILTGCDLSEDPVFPNWRENLHLALRLQQKGETLFPGLFRPLYFCNRNYNMHATSGSLLVEIGTDVNTLEEAQYSGKLLGKTLLAVLEDLAAE